jgi:DNA repair exonuclease SbcCD ATPase subunit
MELDQILKRVQWMDDERRKDKDIISKLETRILALEGNLSGANQQVKELSSEITRLATIITRMDQYDTNLGQQRLETKKQIEEMSKDIRKREEETEKIRRVELRNLDATIFELRKELEMLPKLEKGIQSRAEEENRLNRAIDELRSKIESFRRSEDEYTRTYRLLEDGRRQDSKRLTDLQGEVAATRKRVDDQRGQVELVNTSLRKVETRLHELLSVETERRDAQVAFLDKQNLVQVERDRTWKDWDTRFSTIEKQASDVEAQLAKLELTHREARRSQQSLEELTQRVERRISEMTEIQRLSEDRFRQEWVTFKADDQKRWTNYTLTQEEQRNEVIRQSERLIERITHLEDGLQEEQDLLQQMIEQSEKRLQGLLALSHQWVAENERTLGRVR